MDNLKVLIIDDDKDTAQFFNVMLSMVGFNCDVVNTAKDALLHLTHSEPDIVFLDLRLGLEISGEDILYQIRSNPRFKNTRVAVITAYPTLAESITELVDLILVKPVEVDQLRTLTARLAGKETRPKIDLFRDPVTNLFNAELFLSRLEHAFERNRRHPDYLYAVLVFSVDFQPLNRLPKLDHDRSHLLWQVAERLRGCFRPTDTLARLEDDLMATLHEDLKKPEDRLILEKRLNQSLMTPYQVEERSYQIEIQLGAALNSLDSPNSRDILERARAALSAGSPAGPQ